MTAPEKLTKFVIKAVLSDLQHKKQYRTLDELRDDVESELIREGYELSQEEKDKIKLIVNEEGYTGRFAIDDIIWRKLRNKKYWPWVSLGVAAVIFLITNIASALIEYFVQKPLNTQPPVAGSPKAVVAAFFQLPTKVDSGTLDFKVTLQNQLVDEALQNLVLFASAEESVKKIDIESLPPGGEKIIADNLNIKGVKKNVFAFNAYIIGPKVSFKSDPIMIERMNITSGDEQQPPSAASASGSVAINDKTGLLAMADKRNKDLSSIELRNKVRPESIETYSMKNEISKENACVLRDQKVTVEQAKIEFMEVGSDQLTDELIGEIKALSSDDKQYKNKIQILELLAKTGSEKAKKFLEEHGK